MDPEDYRDDFRDFIQELIDGNELEDAALGVAKLFVDKGEEAFSEKQKHVFDNHVVKQNTIEECKKCSNDIPWCEMYHALDNGGYCSYCWHMVQKEKRE